MSVENTSPAAVTEEALLKSLTDLETKAAVVNQEAAPVVKVESLQKSAVDTVTELASPALKGALDVSAVLEESVALMGVHVDRSLTAMHKSVQAGAERDMAIVRVLQDLKKSIDANTEATHKLLAQPAAPAGSRPVTVTPDQVLTKSASSEGSKTIEKNPAVIRQEVLNGLERLVKSTAGRSPGESARLSSALIKFESTGQISDADMSAALKV